ncbi:MAG: LysE family translocator [Paludibacteraceae bacterium]|nr:LysE family translocator [Paludibacteraceae bacterium]MBN2787118.1 LysE family translocator [Paludibacteraceae bacterium]
MSIDYFIAYFLILFFATITPGPNSVLAINHGLNHGFARSIYSAAGNLVGNLLLALVSILGLSAILIASGIVFTVIKWIGIIYLVYIGLKLLIAPLKAETTEVKEAKPNRYKKKNKLFLDGFVIAIGNPKGILFFTALFPQFITIETATIEEFLIIFITLAVVAFGCYMLYAVLGQKLNALFQAPKFRNLFNRITGSIFIGTGLAIAFSKK